MTLTHDPDGVYPIVPDLTVDDRHRVLDWAPRHDPRSRDYPARTAILEAINGRSSVRPRHKEWKVGPVLDQGYEGACVGFAWTAEALANPVPVDLTRVELNGGETDPDRFAKMIYLQAQVVDEWEGTDYDGTSVNAGAKAVRAHGLVREYRWCFGVEQVRDAILSVGPVVIGIPWYSGMYDAPGGNLAVDGYLVGGHALLVYGYKPGTPGLTNQEPRYLLRNSWGASWGVNGSAWIKESALAALLAENGEAAVATSRSYGRRPK